MRRRLPILLTPLFLALVFLQPPPASAQAQTKITADQPFEAWVYFLEDVTDCGGSLSLIHPFGQHILDYSDDVIVENIGSFAANTELVFSLTPNLPCSTATLFSNNLGHVYIEKYPGTENAWGLAWIIPGQTAHPITFAYLALTPTHRPAIFIHGLGGRPEDWTTGDKRIYFDTLKAEPYNYPEDYLVTYFYADADGNPETYDYQEDITKISADLDSYVNELSQRYLADGGDGKVDIVGFSLGGLIARQYLNENPDDHRVRKLVTIASPHRGAWILNPENWVELIPGAGEFMRRVLTSIATTLLQAFGQNVDLNSPAAQQARTGSDYLSSLNNVSVENLHYDAAYGDIDAEIRQKIFFFEFKKKLTIGDGYITPGSATGIPASNLDTYGFSDEAGLKLDLHVQKTDCGGYELVVDPFSLDELNYHHGKLITHPDVVSRVINLLTTEE